MKIPNKKYIFFWAEENDAYCEADYVLRNYGENCKKAFGFGSEEIALVYHGYSLEFYLTEEEIKRSSENGFKYFSKKINVLNFLKSTKNIRAKADEFIKKYQNIGISSFSDEEFLKFQIELGGILQKLFTHYILTQPEKFKKIENYIYDYLKNLGVDDAKSALHALVQGEEKIEIIKKGKLFENYSKTIKEENYQGGEELLADPYKMIRTDLSLRDKLISDHNVDDGIDKLSGNLAKLTIERMKMRFAWMKLAFYSNLILNEIERRTGVSREEQRYYSSEEHAELSENLKKIDRKTLKEREGGIVKILDNGSMISLSPEESRGFINKIRSNQKSEKILEGTTASPGKTKGRAVILSFRNTEDHNNKIAKMQKGDIIMSEMTKPSIMIACEKAGAIVTDEGGILSHAAIVSRELGIPCIIATRTATQVFQDGDLVEVDADNGMVRILR